MVWDVNSAKGRSHERLSPVTFLDYRALSHVFVDGTGWWYPQVNLTESGKDPLRIDAIETSGNFFSVLGVQPVLGAGFPADTFYSRDRICVISHRLWRDRFGGDPSIVGRPIVLSDNPYVVAGVMPPGFNYPNGTDVWQRLQWDFAQHSRGAHFVEAVFRLQPGATVETVDRELRALTTRLGKEFAATNADWSALSVPLAHEVEGYFRPALFALFGAALLAHIPLPVMAAGILLICWGLVDLAAIRALRRVSRAEFAVMETRMADWKARHAEQAGKVDAKRSHRTPMDFAAVDANRDGYLVRAELRAHHERLRPKREAESKARFEQKFAAADLNRDGRLGRVEVEQAMPRMADRFNWMDDNRDGFLGRDELAQGRHRSR